MMEFSEAILAGFVQGFTELVPISSSGHLVFVHALFGFKPDNFFFDLYLHMATLMAIVLFFWSDILELFRPKKRIWILYLIVATIPAGIVGVLFESRIAPVFQSTGWVSMMLFVTAFFLLSAEPGMRFLVKKKKEVRIGAAFLMGLAQMLALIPGISRSGVTISTGIFSGIQRREVFLFSFLMAIPVISGGFLYKFLTTDVVSNFAANSGPYIAGSISAFLAALFSLRLLWFMLRTSRLYIFGWYCILAGTAGLIFF